MSIYLKLFSLLVCFSKCSWSYAKTCVACIHRLFVTFEGANDLEDKGKGEGEDKGRNQSKGEGTSRSNEDDEDEDDD